MQKRGISPLIATVLIIGFTVALGAVIMVWGGDFVKSIQQGAELTEQRASSCAAASLLAENVEQSEPGKVDFLLENTGQQDIKSIIVRLTGGQGTDSSTKPGLASAGKKAYSVEFDPAKTGVPLTQLEFIPTIDLNGKPNSCTPGITLGSEPTEEQAQELQDIVATCGNGIVDEFEDCDGINLNGNDCILLGYKEGTLACSEYCSLDMTGCSGLPTTCGNGAIDTDETGLPIEECDTDPFGLPTYPPGSPTTCAEALLGEGDLYCTDTCQVDTTLCSGAAVPTTCDGTAIDAGEVCDGTNLGTETCTTQTQGTLPEGTLACQPDCLAYDTTGCTAAPAQTCGNDAKEGIEACDGTDLSGQTCATQGSKYGALSCKEDCSAYNTTKCFSPTFVDPGSFHTWLLTSAGDVYCWGRNTLGQLGDGTNVDSLLPKKSLMSGATRLTTGNTHTCAANSTGAYCWGINTAGELGDGTYVSKNVPTAVVKTVMNSFVSQISAGLTYTCAVTANGMYCWGNNQYGQLGDGTTTTRNVPVAVVKTVMTGVPTQITTGNVHTCAATSAGMYCWGYNTDGEIGDGTKIHRNVPTPVAKDVMTAIPTQITAGVFHTCATNQIDMYCWGKNINGQLGDGTTTTRLVPTKILVTNPTDITAGGYHTCATSTAGMYCWGSNQYGQIGDGTTDRTKLTPTQVQGIVGGKMAPSAGASNTCLLQSGGKVSCWGLNEYGQLGDGTIIQRNTPQEIIVA